MLLPKIEPLEPANTLPPTLAYIAYHAEQNPDELAIILNDQEVSYQVFYRDCGRMLSVLNRFGLNRNHVVAVDAPTSYLHLLILLALEAIGVPSVSYHFGEIEIIQDKLSTFDLVICLPGREPPKAKKMIVMTEDWFNSVMSEKPSVYQERLLITDETPVRLTKSSGTTGEVKWLIHPGRFYRSMLESYGYRAGISKGSRCLLTMGWHLQSFYWFTMACLRAGGTMILPGFGSVEQSLDKYKITHALFLPRDLARITDSLTDDYANAENLTVITISGEVSDIVRKKVQDQLAKHLIVGYGTSEIGVIGTIRDDGTGVPSPGVCIEIVDDQGCPQVGQIGQFRVKSPASIGSYLDKPEASQKMFRDGWFYPGDVGTMSEAGTFQLLGRTDEMFNIGGIKFLPHALEDKLTEELSVKEVCLIVVPNGDGSDQLGVVIVPDGSMPIEDYASNVGSLIPTLYGKPKLFIIDQLPRTENGKLKRRELQDNLVRQKGITG